MLIESMELFGMYKILSRYLASCYIQLASSEELQYIQLASYNLHRKK